MINLYYQRTLLSDLQPLGEFTDTDQAKAHVETLTGTVLDEAVDGVVTSWRGPGTGTYHCIAQVPPTSRQALIMGVVGWDESC